MNQKISVIMSVYKEPEDQLRASIESILNQTYKNFEFIIILDNPDESWRKDLIKSYNDERIKFYINKKNIGLTSSLNEALKYASCDYIARMDADDISLPNRLEKQMKLMKSSGCDMCGACIECFDENGHSDIVKVPSDSKDINKALKVFNCVPHPTWLVKKDVYIKNNGYIDIYACEDYDFIIRAVLNGFKIVNSREVLLRYRLSQNGISRRLIAKQELNAEAVRAYYKKGKSISLNEFNDYCASKKYNKKYIKYCDFYNNNNMRKNSKNIFKKVYYTFLMGMHIIIFFKKLIKKIQEKKARG